MSEDKDAESRQAEARPPQAGPDEARELKEAAEKLVRHARAASQTLVMGYAKQAVAVVDSFLAALEEGGKKEKKKRKRKEKP